ncbi:hypothetical protein K7432_012630 [Basidiobolus ranarum]|uniref:Cytochrome P450 n=1 Tax=Basidiobolus ranarum TaxID=34480 RepID=A0ABR2WKI2_9FUNG
MDDQEHKEYYPMRFVEDPKLSSRTYGFSKSSRSCIGQEFAMIELRQVMLNIASEAVYISNVVGDYS